MRLLYVDYQALVLDFCNRKRQDRTSSSLLRSATPANIKRECMHVYSERKERSEKEERNTLKDFFGLPPEGKDFSYLIKNCHPDRFKPLQNLINGKTKTSDSTNVELLAWLIDYPHRPFVAGMDVELKEEDSGALPARAAETQIPKAENNTVKSEELREKSTEAEEFDSPPMLDSGGEKSKTKRAMTIAVLLVASIFLTGYIVWQQERMKQSAFLMPDRGCMYWTGDHYEETPCNEERKDRLKFPMDLQKMKNFKRILREDTITERSIESIYYIKINGNIEYYTSGGNHPVNVTRRLHKLSPYMFNKYLAKEKSAKEYAVQ